MRGDGRDYQLLEEEEARMAEEMSYDAACCPEFYPDFMRCGSTTIRSIVCARAYFDWRQENYRGSYMRLSFWLETHNVLNGDGNIPLDHGYRLADRIIQRARKAGLIRPRRPRGWEKV